MLKNEAQSYEKVTQRLYHILVKGSLEGKNIWQKKQLRLSLPAQPKKGLGGLIANGIFAMLARSSKG
ncbi:MAG: hypothetical protein B6D37_07155 [Sphingobacteriales bacterium UTBCD1]|nr:MAG: hypothetical protein B6D37_07155 [Sphingobacteriales bacterium UTBCD1]